MKFKKLLMLAIGTAFLFTNAGKPIAIANEIGEIKENATQQVMHLANLASDEEETEDPEEVFSRAIEDYKEEFDDYINITALNVLDKEDVNLPNFDINYIAPTYAEVMNEYQINLEASLSPIQLEKYDLLRQRDYNVYLIPKKLKGDHLDIAIGFPVEEEWCKQWHVLLSGYSTYTWYQNTARRLILEAGTGFTSNKPEINLKNLNIKNGDGVAVTHPDSPKN